MTRSTLLFAFLFVACFLVMQFALMYIPSLLMLLVFGGKPAPFWAQLLSALPALSMLAYITWARRSKVA